VKHLTALLVPLLALAAAALPASARIPAEKPLRAVATIPDAADVLQRIGGERVDVTTLTRGRENLHAVVARPSHLVAMNRADLFVQIGLSLESVFVPGLLEGARNARIQPGAPGFVNLSDGWEALDVPDSLSRRGGDLHPQGNPHMNLDPRAGEHMARVVHDALVRLDPASKDAYDARWAEYRAELAEAKKRWDAEAERFRGKPIAVYHKEFDYFARYYGVELAASIELRPGIPPTPNHLAWVIAEMKRREVRVILIAPWSDGSDVRRVAEATGARIVVVPNQVGGAPGAETWIGLMDLLHGSLADALGDPPSDSAGDAPRTDPGKER
jgi:ABC-type Zn uptake system ZnuABC Zn-binding protein ZnuA